MPLRLITLRAQRYGSPSTGYRRINDANALTAARY
jgi:hypothetical protein